MKANPARTGKLRRTIGVAGSVLIILVLTVAAAAAYYNISGMGKPPEVKFELVARGGSVFLKVLDGAVPQSDWEYQIYDRRSNPPVSWRQGIADLTPGSEIQLAFGLAPSVYRVRIRHVPTAMFLLDSDITI